MHQKHLALYHLPTLQRLKTAKLGIKIEQFFHLSSQRVSSGSQMHEGGIGDLVKLRVVAAEESGFKMFVSYLDK